MRILALMPCYKVMDISAVQSLTAFQAEIYNKGDGFNICYANGFNAALARKILSEFAVKNVFDWVIWLDSDHIYKAEDLYKLIKQAEEINAPMLAATYYLKAKERITAHTRFDAKKGHFTQEELTGGVMETDVVGFGFLLMRWTFLKDMVDRFGEDLFKMDTSSNTTEDVYFCRKVKEAGHKVLFDSGVIVGHLSTVVCI